MHHTSPNSPGRGEGRSVSDGDTLECGGIVSKVPFGQSCEWKIHSGKILCKAETSWDFEGDRKRLSRYSGDKGRAT